MLRSIKGIALILVFSILIMSEPSVNSIVHATVTVSDEFTSDSIDQKWSFTREDSSKWSLKANSGYMRMTCQPGDLYSTMNNAKNVLLQNAPSGDWIITTKVAFAPGEHAQQAGLLVYQDDDNYIKIVRCNNMGTDVIQSAKEISGAFSNSDYNESSTTVYLRISKAGTTYTTYYNMDGGSTWTQVSQYTGINFSNIKLGLVCFGGNAQFSLNADFDFFRLDGETVPDSTTDEYNSSTLNQKWSWVRVDNTKWSLTANPGHMRVTCQPGDLYTTINNAKNVLLQDAPSGDWSINIKVSFTPGEHAQQAGLVVYQDDDNYIKMVRCNNMGTEVIQCAKEISATFSNNDTAESATTLYMRIDKLGSTYTTYYHTSGTSTWKKLNEYAGVNFSSLKIGVICFGGSGGSYPNADFDFLRLNGSVVPIVASGQIDSDEFSTSTPSGFWSWIREDNTKWSLTANSGYMRITCQPGDLYTTINNAKNVLLQDAPSGDWSINTRIAFSPEEHAQQAGLVVYQDDNNYIKIVRCNNMSTEVIQCAKEISGTFSNNDTAESATTLYLRLDKVGTTYLLYYNTDGGTYWNLLTKYTGINFSNIKIGLVCFGGSGGSSPNADFDYFRIYYDNIQREVSVGYLVDDKMNHFITMYNGKTIFSGWEVDESGGYYEQSKIVDDSSSAAITLQRRFLEQTSGKVTLDFKFKMLVNKMDGVTWQLRDGTTKAINILTYQGNICYENSSQNHVILQSYDEEVFYGIKVVADISTNKADIYVNGTLRASQVDFVNNVNSLDCIFIKTGETEVGSIRLKPVRLYKGYVVNEAFIPSITNVPSDWTVSGTGGSAAVEEWRCDVDPDDCSFKVNDISTNGNVNFSKSFDNQSGTIVFEYKFLIPEHVSDMSVELMSDTTTAVKIVTDNSGNICYVNPVGSYQVIQPYKANLWYHVRIVANISTDTADIYINHVLKSEGVNFRNSVNSINNVVYSTPNSGTGIMWIDDILLYLFQPLPQDYVPEPVPVNNNDVIVCMQSFSAWIEGDHAGWDYIIPAFRYPERKTLLGCYDDRFVEACDWQTKWMVDHGVTFKLESWMRGSQKGNPIKGLYCGYCFDNFFDSQYGDLMKIAFIYDHSTINGSSGMEDFQNNVVPHWIEYFFKNPRYMLIDNKPVVGILSVDNMIEEFGSEANVKDAFDYLEQQCINEGFSGLVIMCNNWGNDIDTLYNNKIKNCGFDCTYNYTYFDVYCDPETQKEKMENQRDMGIVPCCATISMGWDARAWYADPQGNNYKWLKPGEFYDILEWVRDTYLPSIPDGSLAKRIITIDNWNEYGEGHMICPTVQYGFGYLDQIRNVFTEKPIHDDVVPTTTQQARMDTIYPNGSW